MDDKDARVTVDIPQNTSFSLAFPKYMTNGDIITMEVKNNITNIEHYV
jgi:hypothetical protein